MLFEIDMIIPNKFLIFLYILEKDGYSLLGFSMHTIQFKQP